MAQKKPLRIVLRSDLRVTFRAAGCCQSACRRRVACKRWIRGNAARVEGPRAAFISGPRCVDVSEGPCCCFLLGVFFFFFFLVLLFKRNAKIPLQPSSVHFFFFFFFLHFFLLFLSPKGNCKRINYVHYVGHSEEWKINVDVFLFVKY